MDDDLYNLMKSIVKKAQAISKYDRYLVDASKNGCSECAALWQEMQAEDTKRLSEMKKVFKSHFYKFNES